VPLVADLRKVPARAISLWAPVIVYMAMIYFVSALPSAPLPQEVSDKSAHLIAYLGLAVVTVRAVAGGLPGRVTLPVAVTALVIASGYGAFDEWHQSFVAGRFADIADWYADTAGVAIGLGLWWAWGIMASRSDV